VRFVPFRPALNYPADYIEKPLPLWLPYAVALALVGTSAGCLLPIRRSRWLLEEGRTAPALVTAHKVTRDSHGARMGIQFTYRFVQLSGVAVEGRSGPGRHPPEIGSTICVLYDPENPRRNAPYPLSLVRLRT